MHAEATISSCLHWSCQANEERRCAMIVTIGSGFGVKDGADL